MATELIAQGAQILLGFVVIPVWLAAGLCDYFCHRVSRIELTSGTRESVLHLIQFGLVGLPIVAALFLDVNAGLLLAFIVFIFLHHAVAFVDVRYANQTRAVTPVEQMVHSFLELLPITAFLLIGALHFGQLAALFGGGDAQWMPHLKLHPLPLWYSASVLAGAAVLNFLPYVEELVRCLRSSRLAASTL
jgi:hypothetical protein